jgi:hypothetical protein
MGRVFICKFISIVRETLSWLPRICKNLHGNIAKRLMGNMYATTVKRKSRGGGIHRENSHLASIRGEVKPYPKVLDDIKTQMLAFVEVSQAEKSKTRKMNAKIESSGEIPMHESGSGTKKPS